MATTNHEFRGAGASPFNDIMLSGGVGIWKLAWSEQHQERVSATRQKSRIKKVRSAKRIREELLSFADQSELALNEVKGVLPGEPTTDCIVPWFYPVLTSVCP